MSRKKVDLKLENVTIEAVAAEGKALTHVDGMVVFVDFAVPGDVVDIQVFRKKKTEWSSSSTLPFRAMSWTSRCSGRRKTIWKASSPG